MTAETFLKELQRLINSFPKSHTHTLNSENCEYGDQLYFCKNMLYCFDCNKSADCLYGFNMYSSVNCVDCNYAINSQLCYEAVEAIGCFNSNFLEYCTNMRDSSFSYNCLNCNDVFGCVSLTNKSFCIFNRQLTEEEYKVQITKFRTLPAEKALAMLEELKQRYPLTQTRGINNVNSPYGNNIDNCKDCYLCFDSSGLENCGYLYDCGTGCKYSYDGVFSGDLELSYESIDSGTLFNCSYAIWSGHCHDSSYILSCSDVKNCLGCTNLAHKEYCILNRQFTKEEYEKIAPKILEDLKSKNLGWGNLIN